MADGGSPPLHPSPSPSTPRSVPRRFRCPTRKNRLRASTNTTPLRLAAARCRAPRSLPALPTLLTRAARPSLHSPPTPQPLAGHRSRAHPIHASPQVAVAGAVEVHWCPRARLGPPAVDHVERLLMRVAVVHARAPRTPPRRFLTPIPRLVSSLHRRGGLLATPWSFRFISRSPVRRPARATRSCAASFASPLTPPSPRPFSLSLSFSLLSLSQQPAAASTSVEKLAMLAQ